MGRSITAKALFAVSAVMLLVSGSSAAQGQEWATIKGRVVWGGDQLPEQKWITVAVDKAHCLTANKTAKDGKILDEGLLVNAKNKGLKNVFVYIPEQPGKKIPIHPKLKDPPKEPVKIDQPACSFFPRALAMREGQSFLVNNTAPVQHNIRWIGDPKYGNEGGNVTIKPNDKFEIRDLKAQPLPLPLECNIHGWMKGRLGVFNHPYFAITDDDGNFEIKLAPVGTYKLMIYHEEIGYRVRGKNAKEGEEHTINVGVTDLGELKMKRAEDK